MTKGKGRAKKKEKEVRRRPRSTISCYHVPSAREETMGGVMVSST